MPLPLPGLVGVVGAGAIVDVEHVALNDHVGEVEAVEVVFSENVRL